MSLREALNIPEKNLFIGDLARLGALEYEMFGCGGEGGSGGGGGGVGRIGGIGVGVGGGGWCWWW